MDFFAAQLEAEHTMKSSGRASFPLRGDGSLVVGVEKSRKKRKVEEQEKGL